MASSYIKYSLISMLLSMLILSVFSKPVSRRHHRSADLAELLDENDESSRIAAIKAERAFQNFKKLCRRLRKKNVRISLDEEARLFSRERREPSPAQWVASLCDTISVD